MGSIKLKYDGAKTDRENLAAVSNTWLSMDEKKKAAYISKNGSDLECQEELIRLEKLCNERYNLCMIYT